MLVLPSLHFLQQLTLTKNMNPFFIIRKIKIIEIIFFRL